MTSQPPLNPRVLVPVDVFEPAQALQQGYLLVDPGALPEDIPLTSFAALTCAPTNWGDLTGLPALIDLTQCEPLQRDWLVSVLENEHEQRNHSPLMRPGICAHLMGTASCSDVAIHLAHQLLVLPVDKSGYRSGAVSLWRLFDPRIFANLCWMLEQDEQHALLGPISAWAFPWFNQWLAFERAVPWRPNPNDSPATSVAHPKPIDMVVWERAQRIAQINRTLARLALSNDMNWEKRAAVAQRIESALAIAKTRLHWDHEEDQIAYAESAIRYGDAFLNHPKLVAYWKLREKRKASAGWTEVLDLLTDDDFQALPQYPLANQTSHDPAPSSRNL